MDWRNLKPKKTKFINTIKMQKGVINNTITTSGISRLNWGIMGLQVVEGGRVKGKELSSCLLYLKKKLKKIGTAAIRAFPDISISKKPLESRLGGGKGAVETWGVRIRPATILLEINTMPRLKYYTSNSITQSLVLLLLKASTKINVSTKIVYKIESLNKQGSTHVNMSKGLDLSCMGGATEKNIGGLKNNNIFNRNLSKFSNVY